MSVPHDSPVSDQGRARTGRPPLRILTVCTANVCRSPVAERLLARQLEAVGRPAVVRSAGTHGGSLPVHRHTLDAASTLGVDLSDHVSRALTAEMLDTEGADLVIAMTREHLRHAVAMQPTAWPRTFTLKELVRRASTAGLALGDDVADWTGELATGRRTADLISAHPDDDVADPYGGAARGHVAMAHELEALCAELARYVGPLGE
jgi:protein-tyrosine phosphatase